MIIDENGIVSYLQGYYNEVALTQSLDTLTDARRNPAISQPENFKLEQNFPNPFNPSTKIFYELKVKNPSFVSLKVFDVLGNEIKTLVQTEQPSGFYETVWSGTNNNNVAAPAGIYFYELRAAGLVESRRMLLLK